MHDSFGESGGVIQDRAGVSNALVGYPVIAIYGILFARAPAAKMLRRR